MAVQTTERLLHQVLTLAMASPWRSPVMNAGPPGSTVSTVSSVSTRPRVVLKWSLLVVKTRALQ